MYKMVEWAMITSSVLKKNGVLTRLVHESAKLQTVQHIYWSSGFQKEKVLYMTTPYFTEENLKKKSNKKQPNNNNFYRIFLNFLQFLNVIF